MFNDLMENIEWFFNLHDKNKDGFLTKDEVLTLSESLLVRLWLMVDEARLISFQFIFRYEIGDAYLGAVSRFMTNAFEYGDALFNPSESRPATVGAKTAPPSGIETNVPYLNLAT